MKHKKHADEAIPQDDISETTVPDELIEDSESDSAPSADTLVDMITEPEAGVAALLAERKKLTQDCNDLRDQVLRARAEFDNFRKRTARDTERVRKTAAENLVRDLLPVVDHLELALQHADSGSASLAEGVEMVLKQMLDVLGRHGVTSIPSVGEPFDPNCHEAVMQDNSGEAPPMTVTREFQRGYRLGDQVLRASKVVVSMDASCEAGCTQCDCEADGPQG